MPSEGLKLLTACAYLTETSAEWRQEDWDAFWMVKALKGDPINAYFHVNIGGKITRFDKSNVSEFIDRVPRALAKSLARHLEGHATLVPIPNSHVTDPGAEGFKTLELAKGIAAASKGQFEVVPALVFKEPQVKSRLGGPRSAAHFEAAYKKVAEVEGPIVLIDDVCTLGGHLVGAHRKLHKPPGQQVVLACAWGRTVKQQLKAPLGLQQETLDLRIR